MCWTWSKNIKAARWQHCPCLPWALDQTPQDSQRQSKGNYFLLLYPLHSSSHKQNSSPLILTEDLETACSISKPDDIRCWILPFDTFAAGTCWFPSPKHFWITFMQNWGPSEGQAAPFSLYSRCSSTMTVVSSVEKHGGLSLRDKGCMTLGPGGPGFNSIQKLWGLAVTQTEAGLHQREREIRWM